jgi:hypothetical protein
LKARLELGQLAARAAIIAQLRAIALTLVSSDAASARVWARSVATVW